MFADLGHFSKKSIKVQIMSTHILISVIKLAEVEIFEYIIGAIK